MVIGKSVCVREEVKIGEGGEYGRWRRRVVTKETKHISTVVPRYLTSMCTWCIKSTQRAASSRMSSA